MDTISTSTYIFVNLVGSSVYTFEETLNYLHDNSYCEENTDVNSNTECPKTKHYVVI